MAWSTRELAELAGVSPRAIRHWHDMRILPVPSRRANGYKQYGNGHLVRVLRIKRLTDLGFRLEQIGELLSREGADGEVAGREVAGGVVLSREVPSQDPPVPDRTMLDRTVLDPAAIPAPESALPAPGLPVAREELLALRADLDGRIEELTRVRDDVDLLLRDGGPPDLSPTARAVLGVLGPDPSSRDAAIILAHFTAPDHLGAVVERLSGMDADMLAIEREIMELPEAASDEAITELASRASRLLRAFITETGGTPPLAPLDDIVPEGELPVDLLKGFMFELMNSAQRRVMASVFDELADL